MTMYTICTAGHVDHGKSSLVKALTGIDPDRLPEEKAREMTIDLGFAWLRLPSGREVSIVDVPGHERFIHNMLAGLGGIDLALLVVAADEGVMPQTREHLAILDLLGVEHGVVAITKKDLVEEEFLELVVLEIHELLDGTSLANMPVVACSAITGEGLEELVAALDSQLAQTAPKRDIGRPRLPIDRVFSLPGLGTIVTGTLVDGCLEVGQEVEILPIGARARIRSMESHRRPVNKALPGGRLALNLPGLGASDLERGMVVTIPGWLEGVKTLDVRLKVVPYLRRPVRHNMEVFFHTGSARETGRLILLDRDELEAGEEGWAQIRLQNPVALIRGDRFIVRDPNDTLGGGVVVDVNVPRHRRFHGATLSRLASLSSADPRQQILALVEQKGHVTWRYLLFHLPASAQELLKTCELLISQGLLVSLPPDVIAEDTVLAAAQAVEAWRKEAKAALGAYHRQWPLRKGMPREGLRVHLGLPPKAFSALVTRWQEEGLLKGEGDWLALATHVPTLSAQQEEEAQKVLQILGEHPYNPPSISDLDGEVIAYLEETGQIVRVSQDIAFISEAYNRMVEQVVEAICKEGPITLARVRDILGTSRRCAQALLEHLDQRRITVRIGDVRVLRQRA